MTDCFIGVLSKEQYLSTLFATQEKIMNDKVSFIQNCVQFSNLSPIVIKEYLHYWRIQRFCKNQVVYQQGKPSETAYLIKSGDFE